MHDPTSQIRRAARLKLSSGVPPDVLVENLVRNGWPREEAVEAVAAEVEARKSSTRKEFKVIHTRKSLIDRIADSAVTVFTGVGIMVSGILLSVLFSWFTSGALIVVFMGLIATGFVITLYGIASGGDD